MAKKAKTKRKSKKALNVGDTVTFSISMYEGERDLLRQLAGQAGMGFSAWCRQHLLAAAGHKAQKRAVGRPRGSKTRSRKKAS